MEKSLMYILMASSTEFLLLTWELESVGHFGWLGGQFFLGGHVTLKAFLFNFLMLSSEFKRRLVVVKGFPTLKVRGGMASGTGLSSKAFTKLFTVNISMAGDTELFRGIGEGESLFPSHFVAFVTG